MYNIVKETHDTIRYRAKILSHLQVFYNPLKGYKQLSTKFDYIREFMNKDGDIKLVLYPTKQCYKTHQFAPSVLHIIDSETLTKLCSYSYYECFSYITYAHCATFTRAIIFSQAIFDTQKVIRKYIDEKGLKHGTLLNELRDLNSSQVQ